MIKQEIKGPEEYKTKPNIYDRKREEPYSIDRSVQQSRMLSKPYKIRDGYDDNPSRSDLYLQNPRLYKNE